VPSFLLEQCLKAEPPEAKSLQQMIAKCDLYCAALNCYRFLLLRDKHHITRVQITAERDIVAFVQPLLLAVEKAQQAARTLPSSEVAVSRLQMVEDLARRVVELGRECGGGERVTLHT